MNSEGVYGRSWAGLTRIPLFPANRTVIANAKPGTLWNNQNFTTGSCFETDFWLHERPGINLFKGFLTAEGTQPDHLQDIMPALNFQKQDTSNFFFNYIRSFKKTISPMGDKTYRSERTYKTYNPTDNTSYNPAYNSIYNPGNNPIYNPVSLMGDNYSFTPVVYTLGKTFNNVFNNVSNNAFDNVFAGGTGFIFNPGDPLPSVNTSQTMRNLSQEFHLVKETGFLNAASDKGHRTKQAGSDSYCRVFSRTLPVFSKSLTFRAEPETGTFPRTFPSVFQTLQTISARNILNNPDKRHPNDTSRNRTQSTIHGSTDTSIHSTDIDFSVDTTNHALHVIQQMKKVTAGHRDIHSHDNQFQTHHQTVNKVDSLYKEFQTSNRSHRELMTEITDQLSGMNKKLDLLQHSQRTRTRPATLINTSPNSKDGGFYDY